MDTRDIIRVRLASWSLKLAGQNATPLALVGIGQGANSGAIVLCIPEDGVSVAEVAQILRGVANQLSPQAATNAPKLFPTCEAVGHCRRPSADAAPFHHFYWDSDRDCERMDKIHNDGAGHADPLSKYGAVICKICGEKALVLSDAEDFPEI